MDRNPEVARFIKGWNWARVYALWHQETRTVQEQLENPLVQVYLYDPAGDRASVDFVWWPRSEVSARREEAQRFFMDYPGSGGLVVGAQHNLGRGELLTLHYLDKVAANPEQVAGLLVAATLFEHCGSRYVNANGNAAYGWPAPWLLRDLATWAQSAWGIAHSALWYPQSNHVVPSDDQYGTPVPTTMTELVRQIANNHVRLLQQWAPIAVHYVGDTHSEVVADMARLRAEMREREAQLRILRKQVKAAEAERKAKEEAFRAAHPRCQEWRGLATAELQRMVWTSPTVEVAKLFGISDVAVAKECRNRGVPKPPLGFWARVAAGRIPHPNGVPDLLAMKGAIRRQKRKQQADLAK